MKFLFVLLVCCGYLPSAFADDQIPLCWTDDQPTADIQDGIFVLHVPTADQSAAAVANLFFNLQGAMLTQTAVGSTISAATLEIDMQANVRDYQPSVAFPTLASLKNYIVGTLKYSLANAKAKGVTVTCAKQIHVHPE